MSKTYAEATHCVIDIETLSTQKDAVILGIGAAVCNVSEGIIAKKHLVFHVSDPINEQRHIDRDTLSWWMKQSKEAQQIYFNPESYGDLTKGVKLLFEFCKYNNVDYYWGNSFDFDLDIIDNAVEMINANRTHEESEIISPWEFWSKRCIRTLVTNSGLMGDTKIEFKGIKHCALDDAVHEAEKLVQCIKQIQKNKLT